MIGIWNFSILPPHCGLKFPVPMWFLMHFFLLFLRISSMTAVISCRNHFYEISSFILIIFLYLFRSSQMSTTAVSTSPSNSSYHMSSPKYTMALCFWKYRWNRPRGFSEYFSWTLLLPTEVKQHDPNIRHVTHAFKESIIYIYGQCPYLGLPFFFFRIL